MVCGNSKCSKNVNYTEELYKKDLHDLDNHDGVITHLEPDILECEVKWALESSNGEGNGTPLQYSCLENLMGRGAWQATVTKSQT